MQRATAKQPRISVSSDPDRRPGGCFSTLCRGPLLADLRCDVAIVGAGITGSFAAEALARQGLSVVVVDRLMPGRGSTAASTAMLQWEIDRSLTELTELYGLDKAADIYRRSYAATADLCDYIQALGISCLFARRSSLYLGGRRRPDAAKGTAPSRSAWRPPRSRHPDRAFHDGPSGRSSRRGRRRPIRRLSLDLLRIALAQGVVLVEDEVVAYDWSSDSASIGLAGAEQWSPTSRPGHGLRDARLRHDRSPSQVFKLVPCNRPAAAKRPLARAGSSGKVHTLISTPERPMTDESWLAARIRPRRM